MTKLNHSRSIWKSAWGLDDHLDFLNHGAFGACPLEVLEHQQAYRRLMERQPLAFLYRDLEPRLDAARQELATLLGANTADLVFVTNATSGVNTVLRSLTFAPGDGILVTNHGYNACRNAVQFVADRWQAQIQLAQIPCPVQTADEIVAAILDAVNDQTRLAVIDHVTSPTAIVFPIEKIVRELSARGIITLVDGAHAPGMVPLDLNALGADFYTGNCHKWLCVPKGSAFLWVALRWHERLRPLTISHGANSRRTDRSRLHLEFDWVGTCDPTPWLCTADAIRFLNRMPGGISQVMRSNRELTLAARTHLISECGYTPSTMDDACIGSIASFHMWDRPANQTPVPPLGYEATQLRLHDEFAIEIPVFVWPSPPQRMFRIAAQQYNDLEQYRYLGTALASLARDECA